MTFYILCDCGDLWGLGTPEGETGRTALHGTQARNCKGWASLWLLRTGAAGQACDRQAQDSLLPPLPWLGCAAHSLFPPGLPCVPCPSSSLGTSAPALPGDSRVCT